MSNLPITTRVARVKASKKRAAVAKQTGDYIDPETENATVIGGTPGSTSTSTVETDVMGSDTDYAHKGPKEKDPVKWEETRKGICNGTIKGDKSKVNCSDVVVGKEKKEIKTETPGNNYTGNLKTSIEGDVMDYWDVKDVGRGINKANRYIKTRNKRLKKYTRKLEGIEKAADDLDGDGVMSEKEIAAVSSRLKGRERRKYDKYTTKRTTELARKKEFESMRDNMANRSGKKAGQSAITGQRDTQLSEVSVPDQKALLAQKAKLAQEKANKAKKNTFKNLLNEVQNLDTNIDFSSVLSNARKSKSPNFKMRGYGKR